MIEAHRLAEGSRSMPFGTADHAGFFGIVVVRTLTITQDRLACGPLDCVRDFVPQSECRRLPSAARRTQRAVRIPRDRVCSRIEVVVTAMIDGKAKRPPRGVEIGEKTPFGRIARQVCFGEVIIRPGPRREHD